MWPATFRRTTGAHPMPRSGPGRPSADDQAAKLAALPNIPGSRPPPPPDLSPEEAEIWDATLGALPSGWVPPEAMPVLMVYVRHCAYARALAERIAFVLPLAERGDPERQKEWLTLLRAHGFQTERMGQLATKLRLLPQNRMAADKARDRRKQAPAGPRPWDDFPSARDEPPTKQ
jgi:hypothetical protein